ncbi:MAG: hypothetical protein MUE70_03440 [Desulfobacterales bacterium]|nr:hypothetical protein [Desulfobacterales bacterium]
MNYKDILKQTIVDPQRALNELGFKTLEALHENTERAYNASLAKFPWVANQNTNAAHEWFEAVKTGRNNIKGLIDENIKNVEGFIAAL